MNAQLENYTNINIFKRCYEKKQVANQEDMIEHVHNHTQAAGTQQRAFNPYVNNNGTTLGKSMLLLTKFY
jgi:hypothetical protein